MSDPHATDTRAGKPLICTRCGKPITGGRDTYTLAPHIPPYYGPMHWPTKRCNDA